MNAKDAIATALHGTKSILTTYLSDLSDADLLVHPGPGANHLAWQLGHLISSEAQLIKGIVPGAAYPELPAGFAQAHSPEATKNESTQGYLKKDQYLSLFDKTRAVTLETLAKVADADLDKKITGRMEKICPNWGAMFLLVSNHTLMHAGQFVVLRRKLNKPILI
jgi:hypothetical protein